MKLAGMFLYLVCMYHSGICQQIRLDTDRMETLIGEWNFAHNTRSTESFEAVYNDTLLFYTQTLPESQAIGLKQQLFAQKPAFQQRISSDIKYTAYTGGVTKCDFTKEVLEEGQWAAYASYVLVSYEDNRYEIVGESDYATDRTLRYTLRIGEPMTFDNVLTSDSPGAAASDSFLSSLKNIGLEPLDSAMHSVDPLRMFPELSSMGTITMPKGYVFLLIAFLSVGGVLIFLADTMQSRVRRKRRATRKPDKADRVVREFKMQSVFEAFVITLFDPLYFRHRRPKAERVLAGKISEGETAPDLAFEFRHKETRARFGVKCLYFRNAARSEIQLFPEQRRPAFKIFEEEHDMPLYFILGFGGTPDDPKELYLLPRQLLTAGTIKKEALKPYSKSGMFFFNSAAGRLQ